MTQIFNWLAKHPLGTAFKVGIGAGLAWVLNNATSLNLSPAQTAVVIMMVNIGINALNPQDARYGKGKDVVYQ